MFSRNAFLGVLFAGAIAVACQGNADDSSAGSSAVTTDGDALGPVHFRQYFAHYLKAEGGYTDEQIQKLVYLPTGDVTSPRVTTLTAASPLSQLDGAFKKIKPSDLYENGKKTPLAPDDPTAVLAAHPVHIVVVPGIFGEFMDVSPFQEVFDDPNSAARLSWQQITADKADDPNATDQQFSIIDQADVARPMSDLLQVGSIDGDDGKPLVTITYLKPARGSFEDFGGLAEDNAYYLRRLKKYFALIGEPENLYVLGYSRGTPVGLDLVSEAAQAPDDNPWIKGLDGFISHAGVIWGTQLADASLIEGSPTRSMLDVLSGLANDLVPCDPNADLVSRGATIAANTAKFDVALAKVTYYATQQARHAEIGQEGLDSASPELGTLFSYTKALFFDDMLHMGSFVTECGPNVQRFQYMVGKVVAGANTLTTASRLDWWRTHTLPAHVRYFAITGTMGDATTAKGVWPGALDPVAYDTQSVDFRSLRGNYYDLVDASGGEQLNDSQVPVQRGIFWPNVIKAVNPSQPPLETYYLGTLGIHHWGLAFPRAFPSNDGLTANPYPRKLLIKAIGAFVAEASAKADAPPPPARVTGYGAKETTAHQAWGSFERHRP